MMQRFFNINEEILFSSKQQNASFYQEKLHFGYLYNIYIKHNINPKMFVTVQGKKVTEGVLGFFYIK